MNLFVSILSQIVFWETFILFSIVSGCTNLRSHQQHRRIPFFSTPSPAFVTCRFLNAGHSDWCDVALIVVLICISLIIRILSIFSCDCWPSVCFLWRNVYLGFLPIFQLDCFSILSCMSCLYILEIKPFSVTSFVTISVNCDTYFLPVCRLSFHFVYGFLWASQVTQW